MAVRDVIRMGHPVLRQIAEPIALPLAPDIEVLLQDMVETMDSVGGTGLAAPQVQVPVRAVVYFVDKKRAGEGQEAVPLTKLINPEIQPLTTDVAYDWEGCLSVPGLIGLVPRPTHIRLRAFSPEGERIEKELSGFHARVLQHECDHLDGVLYPKRMDDLSLLMFRDELEHGMPAKARHLLGLKPIENDEEIEEAGV